MTRRRLALGAVGAALLVALAACGGTDDEGSDTASEEASTPEAREATCTLKGKRKAEVTLRDTGDALVVTFVGQPVPSQGDALYSVTALDESGDNGVQLGMSFLNGEQDGYYVFDFGPVQQANLSDDVSVDGKTVTGKFPVDQLGKLGEEGIAAWSATFNVLGDDVATCPGGGGSLPFPG